MALSKDFETQWKCGLVAMSPKAYCDLENLPPSRMSPEVIAIKRDIISKAGEEVRLILSLLANDPAELLNMGRLNLEEDWNLTQSAIHRFLRVRLKLNYKQIPCVMRELREVFCQLISVRE